MRINLFTIVSTLAVVLAVSLVSVAQAQEPEVKWERANPPQAEPIEVEDVFGKKRKIILVPDPNGSGQLIPVPVPGGKATFNTPTAPDGGALDGTEEPVRKAIEERTSSQGSGVVK